MAICGACLPPWLHMYFECKCMWGTQQHGNRRSGTEDIGPQLHAASCCHASAATLSQSTHPPASCATVSTSPFFIWLPATRANTSGPSSTRAPAVAVRTVSRFCTHTWAGAKAGGRAGGQAGRWAGPAGGQADRWWGHQHPSWVLNGIQGSRLGAQASLQAAGLRQQGGRTAPTWLTSTMAALPLASTCVSAAAAAPEAAPPLPPPPLLLAAAALLVVVLLLLLGMPAEALEL